MNNVLGIVNLHNDISFKGLTNRRPVASVSFLGRYSLIDFVLSNMSNSGMENVGILTKEKPRSLMKHLGFGKEWGFNTKNGGIHLMYNEQYANDKMYNHDVNNMLENLSLLKDSRYDYVVIAPCHMLYRMDYNKLVEAHIESGAPITMAYKVVDNAKTAFINSDYLKIENGCVIEVKRNRGNKPKRNISLETYVINRKRLLELLTFATSMSSFFSLRDCLSWLSDESHINAYEFKGYLRCVDSMEHYLDYSLELLNQSVAKELFDDKWPIYTRTNDTPPSLHSSTADVKHSFVANGAIIEGNVENSIIGRGVRVGKDSVIKNSIILSGAYIKEGSYLDYVIIDKEARIEKVTCLEGTKDNPVFIREEDVV